MKRNHFNQMIKKKNLKVAIRVAKGQLRPTIPTNCPNEIQETLNQCFELDPDLRPNCQQILEQLNF